MANILIVSMVVVALVIGQQADAQVSQFLTNCRNSIRKLTSDLVETNMKLVTDMRRQALGALDDTYQLERLNNSVNGIIKELNTLAEGAGSTSPDAISRTVRAMAGYQAEIFGMFVNPGFALRMYDVWLAYVTETTRSNAQLMSKLPSRCTPN